MRIKTTKLTESQKGYIEGAGLMACACAGCNPPACVATVAAPSAVKALLIGAGYSIGVTAATCLCLHGVFRGANKCVGIEGREMTVKDMEKLCSQDNQYQTIPDTLEMKK